MISTTRGDFIATTNWFVPHVRDVDSAELIAIRNGLYLAAHIGSNKVEVESDYLFVVDSVVRLDNYLGPDTAVIMECKQLAMDLGRYPSNTALGHLQCRP